jgi:hypothetical protein
MTETKEPVIEVTGPFVSLKLRPVQRLDLLQLRIP